MSGDPKSVRARLIALICLAVCATLLSESRAETAIDATKRPTTSSVVTCARHLPVPVPLGVRIAGRQISSISLSGEIPVVLPIWKTIVLGTRGDAEALRAALSAAHCGVGDLAGEILDQSAFAVSGRETEIDLIVLSAAELGIKTKSASLGEIYRRAAQLDFDLCPAEVGPQLRLQYPNQPVGEFLRIAMESIATPHEGFAAFIVGNGGAGLILIGTSARPDLIVPSTVRFVFVRPN